MLLVERGDCATVAKLVKAFKYKYHLFDINCLDPLGRSALSIAIINENPEMMELLLSEGIQVHAGSQQLNFKYMLPIQSRHLLFCFSGHGLYWNSEHICISFRIKYMT